MANSHTSNPTQTHTNNDQSTEEMITNSHHRITNTIRILQINAQKSKAASSLLIKTANDTNSDIIMIQEPYTIDNTIVRFGNWKVLAGHYNTRPKCGILVCNDKLNIALIPWLCSPNICTAMIHQENPIYLLSVYFSPEENDKSCINELVSVTSRIDIKNVIIAGDLNAKSAIWFHNKEDKMGRLVADFMDSNNLISVNMTTHPTFHTPHAEGWTDVCLVSADLGYRISECETMLIPSASDHRYLLTQVSDVIIEEQQTNHHKMHTNWETFQECFSQQ
ncbi:uncharacterized protein LOC111629609 [Centruroides sculpturatus]|uniref:uncharacterized protein LOC111629609 n=1 Tax=Centruroides sculpturatus TaxID=218467 RepID=UPI000C6E9EFC|nr:uncharacterized protein LOC111629609 [Centruroides sculpturatus]